MTRVLQSCLHRLFRFVLRNVVAKTNRPVSACFSFQDDFTLAAPMSVRNVAEPDAPPPQLSETLTPGRHIAWTMLRWLGHKHRRVVSTLVCQLWSDGTFDRFGTRYAKKRNQAKRSREQCKHKTTKADESVQEAGEENLAKELLQKQESARAELSRNNSTSASAVVAAAQKKNGTRKRKRMRTKGTTTACTASQGTPKPSDGSGYCDRGSSEREAKTTQLTSKKYCENVARGLMQARRRCADRHTIVEVEDGEQD